MAKNDIKIKINVDGKEIELTKKQADKLGKSLDKTGKSTKNLGKETDKTTYATKKGINATANGTKNFANMARGISGSLVPAYATLAANVFALTAVFGFLKSAADYRVLKEGQENYAAVTGVAYQTLTNAIIKATDAQVTYTDAAQAAAIGTAAGLSPEQLERLGSAAKTVSIALGRDVTDSFNRLVRGVTKAEPELLDELGIILRLEPATKKYAAALGVSKESLNAFQRTQAVSNEVLEQVKNKFEAINAVMDPNTNKINKLAKAFDDLMNTLKLFIAGPAESLATFFSNNLRAALGALGLFVLPIIKQILPAFDEMAANAEENMNRHNIALQSAKANVVEYELAQKKAALAASTTYSSQLKNLQGMAAGVAPGKKGTGLQALQQGKNISQGQLRALKAQATRQVGVFKNMTKQMRDNWIMTMNQMSTTQKVSFTEKSIGQFKRVELSAKAGFARMKLSYQATIGFMQKITTGFAKFASKAFGIFSAISIGLLLFEGAKAAADKFGLFGEKTKQADDSLSGLLQTQKDFNAELDKMLGKDKQLAEKNLTLGMNQLLQQQSNRLAGAQVGRNLEALATRRAEMSAMGGEFLGETRIRGGIVQKKVGTRMKADFTGRQKQVDVYENLTKAEQAYYDKKQKYIEHENTFRQSLEKQGIVLGELPDTFDNLDEKTKDFLTRNIAAGNAVKFLTNNASTLTETLQKMAVPANKAQIALNSLRQTRDALRLKMKGDYFDGSSEQGKSDIREEARLSGIITGAENQASSTQALKIGKDLAALEQEKLKSKIYGGTILGQQLQTKIKLTEKELEIQKLIDDIEIARLTRDDATDPASVDEKIAQDKQRLALLQQQKKGLSDSINLTKELGVVATEAFANSMQKGIQGVIDGTMSIKDAFKSMAQSILQSLAQVLAKMMAMRVLTGVFGIPMATGGVIPMAKGGIKGYSTGGIATEPTYLVGEAGPEAVVPLPNGRSIPVDMKGNSGTNNVTINVDAAGNSSTTMDGEKGKALGIAIQAAVMETLQREQRPGGVLGGG
jgi:hypothetical protein